MIEAFVVPLPPFAEQQRIVAEVHRRLSLVDGVDMQVGANVKRAMSLREYVPQRSFAG